MPGWLPALTATAIAGALALVAGIGWREIWRITRLFALVGALLFAFQLWQHGVWHAVEVVGDILALILAASAVTTSTTVDEMLDTISRALRPLRRVGVSPERVALAFAIAIRSLPFAFEIARDTLAAARARGLHRNPRAFAVPFVLRMVTHARDTGAALHARGIGDEGGR